MKRIRWIFILLFSLSVAACGGGEPSTSLDVTLTEFSFTPNTFSVPAGEEITLHAVNTGAVAHNFIIMKLDVSVGEQFDDDDFANAYWRVEVEPGGEKTVTFVAPEEPGEYQVVCSTPGHYVAGMIGTLKVVETDEQP